MHIKWKTRYIRYNIESEQFNPLPLTLQGRDNLQHFNHVPMYHYFLNSHRIKVMSALTMKQVAMGK